VAKTPGLVAKTWVTVHPVNDSATRKDRRAGVAAGKPLYTDSFRIKAQLDFGAHLAQDGTGSISSRKETTGSMVVLVRAAAAAGWTPTLDDRVDTGGHDPSLPSIWYVDNARPGGAGRRSGRFKQWHITLADRSARRPAEL